MKKKLTNNWLLKIFSLLAAFLLWIVVINIDNPTDTFTISNIPIKILNEEEALTKNNLTYEILGDQTVSVEVTARRTDRRKITADNFEATIDMSDIYGATGSVAVNITVVDNKSLIRSWTQITRSVKVNVEEMQTKEFEIQVIRQGELADSYTVNENEIVVSPQRVRVKAPESVMNLIDHAGVVVNVDGATDDILAEGEIRLYGADGKETDITDERLSVNVTNATVSLPVDKTNQIGVDVKITGQDAVADGYKYITYKCDPQTVSVTGAKSLIASIDKIVLEEDLTGASEDVTRTYKISDYLPDGLELADGQPDTIEVVFQIEKLTKKNFWISKNKINIVGTLSGFSYQLGDDNTVPVVLEGLSEDLEKVESDDISVMLDVSGIDLPGTYEVALQIKLSETYEAYFDASAGTVRVTVISLNGGTGSADESDTDTGSGSGSESESGESSGASINE